MRNLQVILDGLGQVHFETEEGCAMEKDFGLFVTLLPKGKIKRDLAGPSGEVSLEDTTVQEELILFSELSFTPYAQVVDMIRTSAAFLCVDDESRYIEGKVNPNVHHFIMETVDDLVATLAEENPLHGLLLGTAIEDLPADDGTDARRIQICRELLPLLAAEMRFQFVVNEVLHDLAEKHPLDPETYEGLWELSVTEVLALGDTLSAQYQFRSAVDYYHFLLLHFVSAKTNVAFCQCCGRYFVPKTRSKTIYCDRILKDGKTCKHWGPILKHKLESQQNEVIQAFDRAKRRMYKRYERTADGKQKPTDKDLSYAEYYEWLDRAVRARDDYLAGKLSKGDALNIFDAT